MSPSSMRRATAWCALALVALPLLPASAGTATFASATSGSPVSTLQGRWKEPADGRSAKLQVVGGNASTATTTFTATWTSPYVKARKGLTQMGFGGGQDEARLLAGTGRLSVAVRMRVRGDSWSPWFSFPRNGALTQGDLELSSGVNGGGLGVIWIGRAKPPAMQFQWRLTGRFEGTIGLQLNAEVSVD